MARKVLKLGWEFPPNNWGGLGVACYGLVKGLLNSGATVKLVLPNKQKSYLKNCELLHARTNYSNSFKTQQSVYQNLYTNLFRRIYCYARSCEQVACKNDFDVIHAHDWMTFKAAIKVKQISKKPLVVHVHSTEVDRQGRENIKQRIYDIERNGMMEADKVIAVSNFEKQRIIKYYDIAPEKISVVHNALSNAKRDFNGGPQTKDSTIDFSSFKNKNFKVLFLGRLTGQKGPEYFIQAAKKILRKLSNVEFIVAGDGDMKDKLIHMTEKLKINKKVTFTGFLRGKQIDDIYKLAHVYVMPSVCEPFGLAPLESMINGTPVVVSKDAGVCEIIYNCIKVDFSNVDQISEEVIELLQSPEKHKKLVVEGKKEVAKLSWDDAAQKCLKIYDQVCSEGFECLNLNKKFLNQKFH